MSQQKLDILILNIQKLSVDCHFPRTSRKLFVEKLKSAQYDLKIFYRIMFSEEKMVKTVYITGYKSFELNIYKDDAPEVYYLKQFIAHKLKHLLDEGLEWVLIQGQMGIELWSAEVVIELKKTSQILN